MKRVSLRGQQHGFSLLELAVVLLVLGLLGTVMWRVLPAFKRQPAMVQLQSGTLVEAEEALNGFILANGRLPCPDTSAQGTAGQENCSGAQSTGWLPGRTLGLNLTEPVRYGVLRPLTSAAGLQSRYQPALPPGVAVVNSAGLNFCAALLASARAPGGTLTAGTQAVPLVYGLAVGGATDADGDGSPFDGLNRSADRFELAGTPRRANYDDETLPVGATELLGRLGCVPRLAQVNGAARAVFAAYDIDRYADLYQRFRDFDVVVMEGNVEQAQTGVVLSSIGLAISTGALAVAVVDVVMDPTPLPIAAVAVSTVAEGLAVWGVVQAALNLQGANDALAVAKSKQAPAQSFKSQTAADYLAAQTQLQALLNKGLWP